MIQDNVSEAIENLWLCWVAIIHDIARPVTQRYVPEQDGLFTYTILQMLTGWSVFSGTWAYPLKNGSIMFRNW